MRRSPFPLLTGLLIAGAVGPTEALGCEARSPVRLTPVLELYTSEGCSSCPPADRWLSSLKPLADRGNVVVQAFHVGYWDYIGWVDRFAAPAHTTRQRQLASANGLRNIYTPQLVRNGQDWRDHASAVAGDAPARAHITLRRVAPGTVQADVAPMAGVTAWTAYWTVTENGHSSKVKSGENAGEQLQHDFVVRQYVPVGEYKAAQSLTLHTVAADGRHPQRVNLVVAEPRTGKPLQALSLRCD